jgi:hypothetical protein
MSEFSDLLGIYNHFDECIIMDVALRDYQTTLELYINNIWEKPGTTRANIDDLDLVVVTFKLVQEIHIRNALNSAILMEPEHMSWGMNAIALIGIEDDHVLLDRYKDLPVRFHHAAIQWEDDRRIDVVFANLDIKRAS